MRLIASGIRGSLPAFKNALEEIGYRPEDDLYLLGDIARDSVFVFDLFRQLMEMKNVHPIMGRMDVSFQNWLLAKRYPEAEPSKAVRGYQSWEEAMKGTSNQEIDHIISWIDSWPCAINLPDAFLLYAISINISSERDISALADKRRVGTIERFRNCIIAKEFEDEMITLLTAPTLMLMFKPQKRIFVGNPDNLMGEARAEKMIIKPGLGSGVSIIDLDDMEHSVQDCLAARFTWA